MVSGYPVSPLAIGVNRTVAIIKPLQQWARDDLPGCCATMGLLIESETDLTATTARNPSGKRSRNRVWQIGITSLVRMGMRCYGR